MSRKSPEERSERLVRFLMGLRDPEVAVALREHGFSEEDRREGYRLLEAQTEGAMLAEPAPRDRSRDRLSWLDEFENQWFPIADASLRNRFPAVHERLFRNLSQTAGKELAVSIQIFLDRVEALRKAKAEGAREAVAILEKRGLSPELLAEARANLDALRTLVRAPNPPISAEELARRDQAAWDFYLEWSAIARASIKNGRILRKLGFGKAGRRRQGATPNGEE